MLLQRAEAQRLRTFGDALIVGGVEVSGEIVEAARMVELFGAVEAERVDAQLELPEAVAHLARRGVRVTRQLDGTDWIIGSRLRRDCVSSVWALQEDRP